MPLQKQAINIPFGQGLDTKTDPNQVQLGKFLSLENAVFNNAGLLQKRNGFQLLPVLPNEKSTLLAIQNENLLALGTSLQAYVPTTQQWITKGKFQEMTLEVDSLVRTSTSQSACDVVVGTNNAACIVYLDSSGGYYYAISDALTGEVIVQSTALPTGAVLTRVTQLQSNFIITFFKIVGGGVHLQYIAIPIYQPQNPSIVRDLAVDVNSLTDGYDIVVAGNRMYFSYSSAYSGGTVRTSFLNFDLTVNTVFAAVAGHTASLVSLSADNTSTPIIYLTFVDGTNVYCVNYGYSTSIPAVQSLVTVLSGLTVNHITSAVTFNNNISVNNIFCEITNTYSYAPNARTDYIEKVTMNYNGVVSTPSVLIRSTGLASKAVTYNNTAYMLVNYAGALQPSYFFVDQNGSILAKLAYGNGMKYAATQVLPNAVLGFENGVSNVSIGYLFADQLQPVNKSINADSVNGVYAQMGINVAQFYFNDGAITTSEIADSLHMTGGFMWQYDGNIPVEHGFFVYPEDIAASYATTGGGIAASVNSIQQQYFYQVTYEWTDAAGNIHRSAPSIPISVDLANQTGTPITFTGTFLNNSTTIAVSSTAGLHIGQTIIDSTNSGYFSPNTRIVGIGSSTITIDQPTTHAGSGDTLTTDDTFAITLKIPTLRLTYKGAPNNARIVVYRWSTAQQIFYQVTSINNPIVNDPTIDSITYTDVKNDAEIIGNLILYTTGGVYENIGAPACQFSTLYKSRLWFVDAQNPNTLWYSKPVIQNTPVEFSDLQTVYVAPTIGAQGSTGPITALSSMDDKLIIFKKNAIYYINGQGPDVTGANNDYSDPILITTTVGCVNQNSIVFTPQGLMFQSSGKGIWILGRGLDTNYIGAPVEAYNQYQVLSSASVPQTNQIRFSLSNGTMLMFDYYYSQWGTFSNLPAISNIIYNNKHTYLDNYDRVFQENPGNYLDGSIPVLMSFTTAWAKLADLQGYQRAYFFYLLGTYKSPHTLTLNIAFDYDSNPTQSTLIQPVNFNPAYGNDPLYGNQSPYGGPSNVEQWRVFLTNQKCQSMQINLQENYDPSFGTIAGAGLTLSGINFVMGIKKGYTTLKPSLSTS